MSELVNKAIVFATGKHAGQVRKFTGIPYILHPLEVASIIATMTSDENTISAGILHDTLEDTECTPEEIWENFGQRVYGLVSSETEDKIVTRSASETWLERKQDSLLALQYTKDINVKIMWLADKLSNIRSFYREYLKDGDNIWLHLNQKDKNMQAWYYRSILENLQELSDTAAYSEFSYLINALFGGNTND